MLEFPPGRHLIRLLPNPVLPEERDIFIMITINLSLAAAKSLHGPWEAAASWLLTDTSASFYFHLMNGGAAEPQVSPAQVKTKAAGNRSCQRLMFSPGECFIFV